MVLKLFPFLIFLLVSIVAEANTDAQEALATVRDSASFIEQRVCNNVSGIQSGGTGQYQVCEPYWPRQQSVAITAPPQNGAQAESGDSSAVSEVGVPEWAEEIRENPDSTDKSSENFTGDSSPAEMAERGRTMASPAELREIETLYAQTRASVASRCCGTDRECRSVFSRVPLQFCTNPRATTHPNEPDRCTGRESGIYTVRDDELYLSWWLLRISRLPQAQREATRAYILREHPQLKARLGDVVPGTIVVSRYKRATDGATLVTLRHELGHACSNIRRQIATRDGSRSNPGNDFSGVENYCRYSDQSFQHYSFMGDLMHPENSRRTGECISSRIREEFRDRSDQAYIPNACYGAKIEEGMAEAFALLTATTENIFENIERSCTYPPSRVHFTGHKIVQCIVENSPNFRSRILSAPLCRVSQTAEAAAPLTEGGFLQPGQRQFMNNVLLSSPSPAVPQNPAPSSIQPSSQEPAGVGQ